MGKKVILIIINCLVLIGIFAFFLCFMSKDIFSGDDIIFRINSESNIEFFNINIFVTEFFTKLAGEYLPLVFNINPHTFSMTVGAVIRSAFVVLLCSVMALFPFNNREKTITSSLFTLISALYFIYAASNTDFSVINPNLLPSYDITGSFVLLTEYFHHFGEFLPFILCLYGIFFVLNHFTQNKLPDKKYIPIYSVYAFFVGFLSVFSGILGGLYLIFISLYLLLNNLNKKAVFYEGKVIYIPLFSLIFGMLCLKPASQYFNYFSPDIKFSFLKTLFSEQVIKNCLEYALIIILAAVLYFLALKKSTVIKRTVYSVFVLIFSASAYFLLFSKLNPEIILSLIDIQILYRLVLFTCIMLLLGTCYKELSTEKKTQKVISFVFSLIMIIFFGVQAPFMYTTINLWNQLTEETMVTTYSIEKMYRFYSLRNKTALLPEDALLKIFKIKPFISDKNLKDNDKISKNTFLKYTPFTEKYYKTFYKNPNIVSYKFIDSKTAIKIFFEEGGFISADEIKKINFQKLYDDKFVLNRAIIKAKYDK